MSQSIVQLGLPPAFLSQIREVIGCFVLGTVLSTAVYGISILQSYMYFRNSGQDSKYMRAFVAFLFTLDTISMVLNIDGLYKYVVTDFGDLLSLAKVPVSLAYLNGITVLIGTLTQCFFAYRLWALSKGKTRLVGSIVVVSLCSFGPGMVIFVHLYRDLI
ncbi:hypothetical protein LXA43DRAFT_289856 [Ganoderma leucocontextum]|nr:hypothetical protein LXA43DRAFT_289856 [Ganoderma leucocontextum]